MNFLEREVLLLGEEAVEKLGCARVAVFGIGGVGSYVSEALARCGVGEIEIIDSDIIAPSNINRQIHATAETVGRCKVEVMKERIEKINPSAVVKAKKCFFMPENAGDFDFKNYSYVADAVDTVTAKIQIVMSAKEAGVPVISCMGAGNKLNPAAFEVADIYETSVCPLARVMRRELRKRGVKALKVVYSRETPVCSGDNKKAPGSVAFVPSVAGLIMAGEIVRDICGINS